MITDEKLRVIRDAKLIDITDPEKVLKQLTIVEIQEIVGELLTLRQQNRALIEVAGRLANTYQDCGDSECEICSAMRQYKALMKEING